MFVQQKKLTFLTLPSNRVRRLLASTVSIQVALSGFPSQMASAYLVALKSGKGIQILLGFYLEESKRSVFFLPDAGEVAPEKADALFEEGMEFAESIGFVLADADIHQMSPEQLDSYWRKLPVCVMPAEPAPVKESVPPEVKETVKEKKESSVDATIKKEPPVVVKREPPVEKKLAPPPVKAPVPKPSVSLEERQKRCKESLGRFLAAL